VKRKRERKKPESKPRKSQQRERSKKKLMLTPRVLMVKLKLMKSFLRKRLKRVRSLDTTSFWENLKSKRKSLIRQRETPKLLLLRLLKRKRRRRLSLKLLERGPKLQKLLLRKKLDLKLKLLPRPKLKLKGRPKLRREK